MRKSKNDASATKETNKARKENKKAMNEVVENVEVVENAEQLVTYTEGTNEELLKKDTLKVEMYETQAYRTWTIVLKEKKELGIVKRHILKLKENDNYTLKTDIFDMD